jgi:hypothetical protein
MMATWILRDAIRIGNLRPAEDISPTIASTTPPAWLSPQRATRINFKDGYLIAANGAVASFRHPVRYDNAKASHPSMTSTMSPGSPVKFPTSPGTRIHMTSLGGG